uniref:C6 domain-containing protein n=1 Tax=Panagrolaimus davidi TaxID=227884 RepID=A0A914Q234_9BILA
MYTASIDSSAFTSAGSFDLYKRICSENSTNIPINNPTNNSTDGVSGCCSELTQRLTPNSTDDDVLSFTYDSNSCRKAANITCTVSREPSRLGYSSYIVVNRLHYINYGLNTISSKATCTNGKWQMAIPPLNVESLECRTTDWNPSVDTSSKFYFRCN